MKHLNIVLTGTIMALILVACDNEPTATLSTEDQIALNGMKEAYEGGVKANALLKIAVQAGVSTDIHKYDSIFHYCTGNFEMKHNDYTQKGMHDDHFHDIQGMHGMNSMMNNHQQWKDGHHLADHDLMNGLISDHNLIIH